MKVIHTNDFAVYIHQRPAGIAWVDGRIRLDIDHCCVRIGLPRYGGNDSVRNRIAQSFRTSEGKHGLALPQIPVICKLQRSKAGSVHLEQCKIDFAGNADDLRRNEIRFRSKYPLRQNHRCRFALDSTTCTPLRSFHDAWAFVMI